MQDVISEQPAVAKTPAKLAFPGIWADCIAELRRIDRTRQVILAGLAALGALVVFATTAYVLVPDAPPPVEATYTASAASFPITGLPSIGGSYVLSDLSTSALVLTLRQFGANVTGTLTTPGCAAATTTIVTGHFVDDTTLVLTLTIPNQPHSSSIVYTITPSGNGFALAWRDAAGHPQIQHWTAAPTDYARSAPACQSKP